MELLNRVAKAALFYSLKIYPYLDNVIMSAKRLFVLDEVWGDL